RNGKALRRSAGTPESPGARNPAQPPAPVQAGVTEPDPTLASQAAIKAKARKAARQASRDAGNVNLSSGFDPDIIYDAIDDAIIWIAERAYPIEVAVREAIKAHKLPEDAASQIRKGIDDEFANIKAPVSRTLDDAPVPKA